MNWIEFLVACVLISLFQLATSRLVLWQVGRCKALEDKRLPELLARERARAFSDCSGQWQYDLQRISEGFRPMNQAVANLLLSIAENPVATGDRIKGLRWSWRSWIDSGGGER